MKVKNINPLISVCIPVFDTEQYLTQCLRSVWKQDFNSFEIIVVSDDSRGKDLQGRSAKKIIKLSQKECDRYRTENNLAPVKIRFREHKENRGILEVRRTLFSESLGQYITYCDSDDQLEEGALSALYGIVTESEKSQKTYDIVHGTSTAGIFDTEGNFTSSEHNKYGRIFYGNIEGHDIFRRWLINQDFTSTTWGKLFRRQLFEKAFENIPYTQCNMADDLLIFFYVSLYAKSYIGIESKVYKYRINSGMSSKRTIDSLQKWELICSSASVFAVLSQWIEENQNAANSQIILNEDEINKIRELTRFYLSNNLKQLKETVLPELHPQARQLLCDYWGTDFVEIMEKAMDCFALRARNDDIC